METGYFAVEERCKKSMRQVNSGYMRVLGFFRSGSAKADLLDLQETICVR